MYRTVYEDYKYSMQDTGRIYIGCRYTIGELLEAEEAAFKFRMVVERYILPKADLEDTLESHLYYLESGSFLIKIYSQMKARVKVVELQEKKGFFGGIKKEFTTRQMTVEELAQIPPGEKQRRGLVIQELSVSKLALMGL